jgi:hypothetical protein
MTSVSVSEVNVTPLGRQPLAQGCRVVDDAVVDDADPAIAAGLGVSVVLRRRAVRGPPRMPDACLAGEALGQRHLEVTEAACLPEDLAAPGGEDRDPG